MSSGDKRLSSNGLVLTTRTSECYPPGELFVTKLTDEDGNESYEFKDKLGQVLLTRQMEGDIMHDTYYIYDSFGNLRAVLPPLASDLVRIVTNQDYATNQALANYAYLYKYDYRNRCIEKKLPGCAPIVYKYDYADRLIFTQDGEMKEKGVWLFSIPDVFGRVVLTGVTNQAPNVSDIVVKATRGGSYKGYNTSIALANAEIHTVNYYDDYLFLGQDIPRNDDTGFEEDDEYGNWYSKSQKGMLTGTLTAQFTEDGVSDEYLYTVMYYDERGRVTQTKSNNHLGGMEKEYIAYNFTGQPKKRKLVHSGNEDITQVYDYDYDHAGRLETVDHSINGNPSVTLAANEYDELGRVEKTTHGGNANLDNNYRYNIRSWLKSKTGNQFNTDLEYSFAGNISTMEWEQNSKLRKYVYNYDGLSRLLSADFTESKTDEKYSTSYKYDKHGNILSLRREGKADSCYATIDSLAIRYQGNQMVRVTDKGMAVTLPESNVFEQGSTKSIQYAYNKNGAMTKDLNKKIASISYNVLNLPNKLVIDSTTHVYTYTADGRKLRVQQGEDRRDYAGSVIYENSSLKRILVDGGYAEKEGSSWKYYFYFNDHLGNNVVVADQDGNAVQHNSYYPFGLPMATASDSIQSLQPYKYNGKEFERKDGLKLYDYGARHYDAQVGRFMTVDPMAEKKPWLTPYHYCSNNPVNRIDLDGKWDVNVHLYSERSEYGYGIAIVTDRHGNEVYRFTVRAEGVNGRNRTKTGSDTPLGVYDIPDDTPWLSGGSRASYGPNERLNMDGESGEIAESGRTAIRIHGGRQETYNSETGEWIAVSNPQLKKTYGCLRAYDTDMAAFKNITDELQNNDSQEIPGRVNVVDDLEKDKSPDPNRYIIINVTYKVPEEERNYWEQLVNNLLNR